MDEIQGWEKILHEWKAVKRMKRLNQELYDQLFGAILYIRRYSRKHEIRLPNDEALERMTDKIHYLMDAIEPPTSDDRIQPAKNQSSDEEEYRTIFRNMLELPEVTWKERVEGQEQYQAHDSKQRTISDFLDIS